MSERERSVEAMRADMLKPGHIACESCRQNVEWLLDQVAARAQDAERIRELEDTVKAEQAVSEARRVALCQFRDERDAALVKVAALERELEGRDGVLRSLLHWYNNANTDGALLSHIVHEAHALLPAPEPSERSER